MTDLETVKLMTQQIADNASVLIGETNEENVECRVMDITADAETLVKFADGLILAELLTPSDAR